MGNNSQQIKDLSPAAARLLLALLSSRMVGAREEIVLLSGISEYQTFVKAQSQLRAAGFLYVNTTGKERVTLFPAQMKVKE